MPKLLANSTTDAVAIKSSRKKDQVTSLTGASAQKATKPRSLAQILSLDQATISVVDRDLAESRLAIHSIMHSARFSKAEPQNEHQKLDAKKAKKRPLLAKSRP